MRALLFVLPVLANAQFLKNLWRIVTNSQELLQDADECGVLGKVIFDDDENETDRDLRENDLRVDECLWDCDWKPNPYFKKVLKYVSKLNEEADSPTNAHLILSTSPKVPKDLNCLSDCFFRFQQNSTWAKRSKIRRKCSAAGLDRLIPTHLARAVTYTDSKYAESSAFWGPLDTLGDTTDTLASVNPTLDCLNYKGKRIRQNATETSNFIDEDFEELPELDRSTQRVSFVKRLKTKQTAKYKNKSKNRQPAETSSDMCLGVAGECDEEWYWQGNRQFHTNVEAIHKSLEGEDDAEPWKRFMFRAYNPVGTAIEICSLAKFIDIQKYFFDSTKEAVPQDFDVFPSGATCDHFLPDIFSTICRCVGTCKEQDSNLIRLFYTEGGLWSCQTACKAEDGCEFYTLSRPDSPAGVGDPDIQQCKLWSSCDTFTIPKGSTGYKDRGKTIISDHWSGPKTCNEEQKCPLLESTSYEGKNPWIAKRHRQFGSSAVPVKQTNKFPWMCSLKEAGFSGRHKCGVTLLSGNTYNEVVLVSSAHCNFVCKDKETSNTLEVCCCRDKSLSSSCLTTSSYCGKQPELVMAEPGDLNIVCSEHSLQIKPEASSVEEEQVLAIDRITNHPNYDPGSQDDRGGDMKGPYAGYDIAVYHLTEESKTKLKKNMKKEALWPACLPKKLDEYVGSKGIFSGWLDQEPSYRVSTNKISAYEFNYLTLQTTLVETVPCRDPVWMRSTTSSFYNEDTFYPKGTECFRDTTQASCFLFGNSGSGVVRQFSKTSSQEEQYAFTGPLSMSKSCDQILIVDNKITYSSENPGVFTDAYCYLPWIAAMYGMKLPESYTPNASCGRSTGHRRNIDRPMCRGRDAENLNRGGEDPPPPEIRECDFTYQEEGSREVHDRCKLYAQEGFAYNIYLCKDKSGNNMTCANNCRGVDPNSVIIGGGAVLGATAVGGITIGQALLLGLPAAGAGVVAMNRGCPLGRCRARDARRPGRSRCCRLRGRGGRIQCPIRC